MKAKLDHYRIFNEVATCLSFSKAGEKLYISQSAVSQAIKQLETDLETNLFKRYAKGVILTKEGEILYEYIKQSLSSIMIAEKKLFDMKNLESGSLFIGAGDTITKNLLLSYLEQFHTKYPNIRLEVFNRTSLELVELVKNGRLDIAFVNLPIREKELETHEWIPIHDIFVCGNKTKRKKSYTRKEIAELPLILLEKNSNSRNFVDQQFKKSDITLQPQIEIGAHDLLLQFAKIDLGISCIIKEFATNELENNSIYEMKLDQPLEPRSIGYIINKQMPLSNTTKLFINILK